MPAANFLLAEIFVPAANFVLAGNFVPAANFVLAGIFVPAGNFVLARIFVLAGIFVPAANFVLAENFVLAGFFVPAVNFVLAAIFVLAGIFVFLFVLLLDVPKSTTMAMARRTAHLITSFLGKLEEAVNQYFVMGARVLDSRPSGRGFVPHRRHCIVPLSKTH